MRERQTEKNEHRKRLVSHYTLSLALTNCCLLRRLSTMSWCTRASFKHKHTQPVVRSTCQLLQLSLPLTQTQHNKQKRLLERSGSDADWAEAGTHSRRFTRRGSVFKHGGCDCIRPQLTLHSQNSPLTRGNQARDGLHTSCGAIKGTDLQELGPVQTLHVFALLSKSFSLQSQSLTAKSCCFKHQISHKSAVFLKQHVNLNLT